MKPYFPRRLWRDDEFGPTSKRRKLKSKNRREWRRIMSKKSRNQAKRDLNARIQDV